MAEHEAELQSSSSMTAAAAEDEDEDEDRDDDDDGAGSPAAFARSFTEFLLLAAVGGFVNLVLAGCVELKMENSALKLLLLLLLLLVFLASCPSFMVVDSQLTGWREKGKQKEKEKSRNKREGGKGGGECSSSALCK